MSHRRHTRVELGGAGDIENISGGGMFLRTTAALAVGLPVTIDLRWSGGKDTLQLGGRVVNVVSREEADRQGGAAGVAIEFDALPADTEKRLRSLLDQLDRRAQIGLTATAIPSSSNVRGLLEALTEALQTLKLRDEEIAQLKAELRRSKP